MSPPIVRHLLRTTPSVAPILNRAVLSVSGSQATQFLNGLLSSSVQDPPRSQYTSFLHAQGRIMYDLFLYSTSNGYLLEFDSRNSEAPPLLSYLKRHVLRSKVKIRNVTEEYDVWAAWGSLKDHEWESERQWNWARSGAVEPVWDSSHEWPWGTHECVINDRRAVNMGRRMLVRKGEPPQDSATHDTVPSDEYTLHRILHGVPEGVVDIPPMHAFPMDCNLDVMGGLDFRKGCYVGQELTVRTYHTGVIRKRIVPVAIHNNQVLRENPLPDDLEIKPVVVNTERQGPRPRGSGKLLSVHKGVGLALMRLEHLSGVERGDLKLEIESLDQANSAKWEVSPWWPNWWPSSRPEMEQ
ncbi:Putative transferase CAF17, mitochondrial [Psilocybe cubensis]|uniref:Transferase CAF17, mitochondrial n=2 Tax=Psilocybe cubensis TaxID=181762 RepID=A0ACB8H4Y4_PSICU|nr:Putative transferase CAF17, mitochondrial [Psilocybe cubensis]KAH9482904.1 Putative transferase CAF17, mitochondrial [Psilocybe cubensis]